jgi:hypothetical protein
MSKKAGISFFFFFLLLHLMSCKGPTAPTDDRAVRWKEDIDVLSSGLKSNQKDFSALVSERYFDSTVSSIENSIDALQDYEIYLKLEQLVASLHIAHTMLQPSATQQFHLLPVIGMKFSDGFYIIRSDNQHAALLGKRTLGGR